MFKKNTLILVLMLSFLAKAQDTKKTFPLKWSVGDHKVYLHEIQKVVQKKDTAFYDNPTSYTTVIDVKDETPENYTLDIKFVNPAYKLATYIYKNTVNVLPELEHLHYTYSLNKKDYSLNLLNWKDVKKEYKKTAKKIQNYFFSDIKKKDPKMAPMGSMLYSYIGGAIDKLQVAYSSKKSMEDIMDSEIAFIFNSFGEEFKINHETSTDGITAIKKLKTQSLKTLVTTTNSEIDSNGIFSSEIVSLFFLVPNDNTDQKPKSSYRKITVLTELDFQSSWLKKWSREDKTLSNKKLAKGNRTTITLQKQ
ncbi:exported protein of unknown function [Tenacibaculum sp. 190130A14a]|uniref:Uncharacterized protein n=1 Tax=Tenacibaculum polynesiense TaxID=3137857 RepID=A0ABM9PFY7_9FLAO